MSIAVYLSPLTSLRYIHCSTVYSKGLDQLNVDYRP